MNDVSPMGDTIPVRGLDLMAALAASGASSIRITDNRDPDTVPIRLRLLTCVEIVKRLLNIRQATLLTPSQLFRHIAGFASPKH